ncbi:hypothetical protein DENSPDRAFT_319093 [Dentipellis sp. KUC8613]|nr:hypothetical protein DENSPDRAFT_319093 [Dentipellis sp. KUC8613]
MLHATPKSFHLYYRRPGPHRTVSHSRTGERGHLATPNHHEPHLILLLVLPSRPFHRRHDHAHHSDTARARRPVPPSPRASEQRSYSPPGVHAVIDYDSVAIDPAADPRPSTRVQYRPSA